MGKLILAGAVAVGALVLAYAVGAPLGVVLGVAAGALALLWLLVLLTVPWNLYFQAHTVLSEIGVSRAKGLEVPGVRAAEAAGIARIMLVTAVAGHLVTAAGVLALAWAKGSGAGFWIAGFFLLSTVFRPAGAWFGQVRRRLRRLLRDVTYPRDDVVELKGAVERLTRGATVLAGKAEEQYRALAELRRTMEALSASVYARADDAERRIAALGREFEATVNRLTTNEEIIGGVKAFLRLLRTEDLGAPGVPPP